MFFKLKILLIKIYLFLLSFIIFFLNFILRINVLIQQKNLVNWILVAQKANNSFGISKGYFFIKLPKYSNGWHKEYPETTGYLLPTLLKLSLKKIYPYENILSIADWLLDIQKVDGSYKGGTIDSDEESSIFDTGQIIKGIYSLYVHNKDSKYLVSALRACDWILKNENSNQGHWNKFKTKALKDHDITFNIYTADIIAEIGNAISNYNYVNLANRVGSYTLNKIRPNLWVEGCELAYIKYPVTHTLAYTIEGLYNVGSALNNDAFINKSIKILDVIIQKIDKNGYLPGYFDENWNELNFGSCLTGSAQIGCLCMKVYKSTGKIIYLVTAKKIYRYLSLRLNNYFKSFGGGIGSLPGSWPINGKYFAYFTTNWTIKYMIDLSILIEDHL